MIGAHELLIISCYNYLLINLSVHTLVKPQLFLLNFYQKKKSTVIVVTTRKIRKVLAEIIRLQRQAVRRKNVCNWRKTFILDHTCRMGCRIGRNFKRNIFLALEWFYRHSEKTYFQKKRFHIFAQESPQPQPQPPTGLVKAHMSLVLCAPSPKMVELQKRAKEV